MPNLKNKSNKKIISNNVPEIEEYPIFCFKHLTTNKKYNFEYFEVEKDITKAKSLVFDRIFELQKKTWKELGLERKGTAFETIPSTQIKFSPNNLPITKDTKVIVFRLNSQEWRLLGVKSQNFKSVLHVIGFDFNYKAYKH